MASTDDGLPLPPGAVTTIWSQVSGPGTVTFANPSAVDTTASFSASGGYVLRLMADDGHRTANDAATITVQGEFNQESVGKVENHKHNAYATAALNRVAMIGSLRPHNRPIFPAR